MRLKGKRIACFVALPHHTRFLLPVTETAKKYGADILFFLTTSDYPFERDLFKKKIAYKYLNEYMNDEIRDKIENSFNMFLNQWSEKLFYWDGFRQWTFLEQERMMSSCFEEYFCLEEFIRKERPDVFIALHERNRWGKIIGHLSYKYAIPFITLQEGDYHEDRLSFSAHNEYSIVNLLWGEATKNMLVRHKCPEDKIILVGNTHLDNAKKIYSEPAKIKQIKHELKIPSDKRVLFFLIDLEWGAVMDGWVWETFLKGLREDIVAVFKWHPNVSHGTYLKIEENIKNVAPSAIVLHTYDPYALLGIADYCVTLGKTTLALEAVAFGKPLFAIPSRDGTKDYYVQMGVAQSVSPPGNWKALYDTIENGVPEDIKRNADEYLRKSFYRLDGRAVERAIEVISYILECRMDKRAKEQKCNSVTAQKELQNSRVSFIIPSGNDAEALLSTLTSLSQNVKYPDWEVVIVINSEDVKEILSGISGDVKIVESHGDDLSLLYNKGAEAASGGHLIFMKPGIVYFKDDGLLDAMKDSIAGMALRNPDMTPYCLGIGFDFNFAPYFIKEEHQGSTPTDQHITHSLPHAVGGGLLGMYRDIFEEIGGFDEGIANHLIEADICLSAKAHGYSITYLPDCLSIVYKETFVQKAGDRGQTTEEDWKRRIKFFAKWWGKLPKDDDYIKFAGDLLKV
ncbi:hypothetical protein JZK55_10030 [Dissulfurispira thermophila]|uniref:Glycosyltransferase 2-like domain-containing protein n=2 Tax=root TaxID=1 RepID=A0A7G1H1U4_9BACT|nr:glycosyltransferase [Dissulfurispira thermophila]BCB96081.1 hypothetical protein JZK55_10030 [Dissulfurispira thermophila]